MALMFKTTRWDLLAVNGVDAAFVPEQNRAQCLVCRAFFGTIFIHPAGCIMFYKPRMNIFAETSSAVVQRHQMWVSPPTPPPTRHNVHAGTSNLVSGELQRLMAMYPPPKNGHAATSRDMLHMVFDQNDADNQSEQNSL